MAIYLEKVIVVNRAPLGQMELDFSQKSISVLMGANGKGKTTILSYMVDAFHELAKKHYKNEFEGKESKYYRISSPIYNIDGSKPSFVYLRFNNNGEKADYIEIRNGFTQLEYDNAIKIENKIPYNVIKEQIGKGNNLKYWHVNSESFVSSAFENNLLTYFPSYRYELPSYLGDSYRVNLDFKKDSDYTGYLKNPIEVVSGMRQIANWMMDVVLDWEVYKTTEEQKLPTGQTLSLDTTPEYIIWNDLNTIVRNSLLDKKCSTPSLRLGIGRRSSSASRISIVSEQNGKVDSVISPNLFCLSSGEKAMICCFGELLRQADAIMPNKYLGSVQGIVLIDEVDLHLHIRLQKENLPKLFNLFPNVQFIVTSHSPFLTMGLADVSKERTQIIDLDNGGITSTPQNNKQFLEVYNLMIDENHRFAEQLTKLKDEIKNTQKPIIITEGKTDIKHILKAKEKLGANDLDFGVIDKENQPDGYNNLESLLVQLGKVSRPNKIIGIFDRDRDEIIKSIEKDGQMIRDFGNGVFAFCIPVPETRHNNGQDKISIEYLYSDDEVKMELDNGCRLFFGTEFKKHSMKHNTEPLFLALPKGKGEDKVIENNGGQAVYDDDDNNHLAKKDDFAEAIVNDKIAISAESWNNFIPIFETIRTILQQ